MKGTTFPRLGYSLFAGSMKKVKSDRTATGPARDGERWRAWQQEKSQKNASKIEDAVELRDPGCMASIFRYTDAADGAKSRILFSGPQSTKRENGTVFLSYDEGATWPVHRVLCKDSFAYSCLTALP